MHVPAILDAGVVDVVSPIAVALLYIAASSLLAEPQRRNFNAVMIAGAGAAYLNGGFGAWEFGFTAILTYLAYRGLGSYRFIAVGWLLHSGWDVLHDLYGNPIVPFAPTSSLGCAICDPVIALWCFAGAPSIFDPVIALWCFAGAPSIFDRFRRGRFFAR